jgi:hypothetical protein
MKRDPETALRAYYEALAAEPIPAIEVRLGRRISGPVLPLAAGVCAAALLPMLAPAGKAPTQPIMGMATTEGEKLDTQTLLESPGETWVV